MEEFLEPSMLLLQCGVAVAVPAILSAAVNLGCGKKRDQPLRPGGGSKKDLSKSKAGGGSIKSKRSTKSAAGASTKSGKKSSKKDSSSKKDASKSKRSSKSKIDKSGKKSKKSSKSSKGSKSSKSKKSKRDVQLQKTGPPSSLRADEVVTAKLQPSSARAAAIEAEKRSAKQASVHAAAALANENSVKSAATQQYSTSLKQPPSGSAAAGPVVLDSNGNPVANAGAVGGTTAIVAVGGDSTRELKMEPAELRWTSAGGMQKISLVNQSNERQAVKVKCSDNNVYRVNPVYAIVEPGQTLNVDVMRQNGSNKVDKIVFVTTRAGLEENPKALFKPGAQSSMMVLPLLATSTAAAAINQPALAAAN